MRTNILAFVFGIWLLQQQAALPGLAWFGLLLPLWLVGRFLPTVRHVGYWPRCFFSGSVSSGPLSFASVRCRAA
jgi:hypothetical protein